VTFDENNEVITETSGGQFVSYRAIYRYVQQVALFTETSGGQTMWDLNVGLVVHDGNQCHVTLPEPGDWWMSVRLHATDPTPAMGWTFWKMK
jgi:hypothetical protein